MEELKEAIKLICLSGLFVGIINAFVSDEKRAKIINLVTGLVFLILIINPFIRNDYKFQSDIINYNIDTDDATLDSVNSVILEETEKRLCEILSEEVTECSLEVQSIEVTCKISEDKSVSIENIECVVLENAEHAKRILKERIGNEDCLVVTEKLS